MKEEISVLIASILKELGAGDVVVEVSVPENPGNGDFSTNIALRVASQLKKPAMEVALSVKKVIEDRKKRVSLNSKDQNIQQKYQKISDKFPANRILQAIDKVEVAPPGFINVFLTEASLSTELAEVLKDKEAYGTGKTGRGKRVMVEYAHPNTHKAFHIGHLRNISTGESIIRLLETVGYKVIRANYQGDVGMHIAKALYALLRLSAISSQLPVIRKADFKTKVEFLGKAYAAGSSNYDGSAEVKKEVAGINKEIYAKDPRVYPIYQETRQWSLDYFETIYSRVGSRFDRYYFESECVSGIDLARDAVKRGVLKEDDGAIIFDGKPYGLDTRVFVNSLGLPTYEAKELALAQKESTQFGKLDRIIHVVGPEQASFFKVTFKVEELLGMLSAGVQYHLIYGWVKLKHGKMSSRSGNVVLGEWLLDEAKQSIYKILEKSDTPQQEKDMIAEKAAVAAVKYSFLRVSTESEIAFDLKESINLQGDSGPYLQYTYARCKSVLRKSGSGLEKPQGQTHLNTEERAVARLMMQFPDVVAEAATNFAPSTLCSYLNKLAQAFNLFYAKHEILGSPSRLALTAATAKVLRNGLYLLGIDTLEQM